jgi:natural product biosynthesis luciferase-like monooxygenase protein
MKFGLIFFASTEDTLDRSNRYKLITEAAQYADQQGFSSIWVPERHFTKFGCLFPNPAVLQASLATITQQIQLRAGSVVVPLHNPIRIVEEWSVVDNLSGGRAGISIAPGWNANDFAFFPERYKNRKQLMLEGMEQIKQLWSGNKFQATSGSGKTVELQIYPPPVQEQLPIWVTAASNPQTFINAGEIGANLLTHTNDQTIPVLAEKIALYRKARAEKGYDPNEGQVTVLLHTFVGPKMQEVMDKVRQPYCDYLKGNMGLLKGFAYSRGNELSIEDMSEEDLDDFTQFVFERFARERGLIGTPESCLPLVQSLQDAGVDELACLLDFGPDASLILEHLPYLSELKSLAEKALKEPSSSGTSTRPHPSNSSDNQPIQQVTSPPLVEAVEEKLSDIKDRCHKTINASDFYQTYLPASIELKDSFKGLQSLWIGKEEALGHIRLPNDQDFSYEMPRFHPALMDACFQIVAAISDINSKEENFYLPVGIENLTSFEHTSGNNVWSHVKTSTTQNGNDSFFTATVTLYNEQEEVAMKIEKLRLQKIQVEVPKQEQENIYNLNWEPISPSTGSSGLAENSSWVLFIDETGVGQQTAQCLKAKGAEVFEVYPISSKKETTTHCLKVDPASPESFALLWEKLKARGTQGQSKLLYFWPLDVPEQGQLSSFSIDQYLDQKLSPTLTLLQSLLNISSQQAWQLWFITQNAQACNSLDDCSNFLQNSFWGLGRAAANELDKYWGGIVDLTAASPREKSVESLVKVVCTPQSDRAIAIREEANYALRMQRSWQEQQQGNRFSAEATYLITGGTGGLGLRCADWLVEQGTTNLILLGRSQPETSKLHAIERLKAKGANIKFLAADVSNYDEMKIIFEEIHQTAQPLKGIFHLAGILNDGMIHDQDWPNFKEVLAAKCQGSWNLHTLSAQDELDYFVLFSSISSLLPQEGQAAYASANAVLDGFSHYRKTQGLSALTVNWGPWGELGHASTDYGQKAHEAAALQGVKSLKPDHGFQLLGKMLRQANAQCCAAAFDWTLLRANAAELTAQPIIAELAKSEDKNNTEDTNNEFVHHLDALSPEQRNKELEEYVIKTIAKILKTEASSIQTHLSLHQMGMDSLMSIELRNRFQKDLKKKFSLVKFMQATSIGKIVHELNKQVVVKEEQHMATKNNSEAASTKTAENGQLLDIDSYTEEELDALIQELDV